MAKILKWIATLGPIGYLPAPGTMGTLAVMPFAFVMSSMSLYWQFSITILSFPVFYLVIGGALRHFRTSDPSQIVIDEVMGALVTFCAIPYNPYSMVVGFVLFRLFDIFKPFGIGKLEKIGGSFGILIDDVVAGLFAHLILRLLFI